MNDGPRTFVVVGKVLLVDRIFIFQIGILVRKQKTKLNSCWTVLYGHYSEESYPYWGKSSVKLLWIFLEKPIFVYAYYIFVCILGNSLPLSNSCLNESEKSYPPGGGVMATL